MTLNLNKSYGGTFYPSPQEKVGLVCCMKKFGRIKWCLSLNVSVINLGSAQ